MRRPTIRHATFDYGGIYGKTHSWMCRTVRRATAEGFSFMDMEINPDALIERNRSRILGIFLQQTTDDILLMVDRDIDPMSSETFIGLCCAAYSKQAVIGGIYCKKSFGDGWAGSSKDAVEMRIGDPKAQPIEANYIAGGALAIPRSVVLKYQDFLYTKHRECLSGQHAIDDYNLSLARIRDNYGTRGHFHFYDWFKTYRQDCGDGSGDSVIIGEDQAFCRRLQYCGETLYLEQRYAIGHIGQFTYMPNHGVKCAQ